MASIVIPRFFGKPTALLMAKNAIQCTDSGKALGAATREIGIVHRSVYLAAAVRVVTKIYHVHNVNAYDSRLKEWIRRFYDIASRYLANYLGWRRMIDKTRASLSSCAVILATLGINSDQQLRVS
jgi:hypothetical protein